MSVVSPPEVSAQPPDGNSQASDSDPALVALALEHGLRPSAARPSPVAYAGLLWSRRHFIMGFATARNVAMYTEARLGQLWQVLTPLLNAAVYYLIFGLILDTAKGVPNFIPFLITGIFVWNFTQRTFITTSRVMPDSLPLIRALPFPRACLPIGYVIIELQQLAMSLVILTAIVLGTGQPLTWYWLLAIPALALQSVFNVGMGLFLARLGAGADDFSQLMPFLVRTWMYTSGVMFSIETISTLKNHPTIIYLLQINPAAVYISLMRNAVLASQRQAWPGSKPYNEGLCTLYHQATDGTLPHAAAAHFAATNVNPLTLSSYCPGPIAMNDLWLWGAGWAVAALVAGYLFFWQAETRYGRG
ncbi:MAG TPA: ABC transporter permease [Streptosporangiaceae bacterium]|nr:ABC transporter permease [Streptosporangiaceae bacterium]